MIICKSLFNWGLALQQFTFLYGCLTFFKKFRLLNYTIHCDLLCKNDYAWLFVQEHSKKSLFMACHGLLLFVATLIKKFFSHIRKFRREQLHNHIQLTASSYMTRNCSFPHILGSTSSSMTLQLLPSEFPYM
jgi:hypothetical protein